MVAGQTLGAEHLGIECLGILGSELHIREFNQNHQTMEIRQIKACS